jgi:hypothetical protein
MISSRLRRRGPQRITPQVVPVIQGKLDWALRRKRTLETDSKKAIHKEWHGKWYSGHVGAAGVAWLPSTEAPSALVSEPSSTATTAKWITVLIGI